MGKEEIRSKIDAIDAKILDLMNRRAKLAVQTSQFKKFYYDPVREAQIFRRLESLNAGPLQKNHVAAVYREILSACRSLQKEFKVAFLGPRATFSHQAAVKNFGTSIVERPCGEIGIVFDEVEREIADYGVVPFENSTEGVISATLDRFAQSTVSVCGEVYVDVNLCLLSRESDISKIKRIYSMPKPLEQCAEWLRVNAGTMEIVQVSSTGKAAQIAAKNPGTAAIASNLAAEIYKLKILEPHIEDIKNNRTRFLVISRQTCARTGKDKTSVLFTVHHEAGTLYRSLKPFEKHEVNLTMIQARPSKQAPWEYVFFLDCQGHSDDEQIQKAISETRKQTVFFKNLGSYPESSD